ncbi:hypothetical protein [Pedobacter montanisoli]|uniref:Lacal_2735 family protein n=1 Tax=Pedobacter montanisoli TaxID=2923277 RepID=A0ABS9ZZG6_9SPHI|nr:hypothetical protein [Pedobacter montanisoli]MCJ0743716.1 hypothetical protein [Pedobacter montanisoli]
MSKSNKYKQIITNLLNKSKALRERSKITEAKLHELKTQYDEFMHLDKDKQDKQAT